MNTLFFIGNGFDINLGLPTRYRDFYRYYIGRPAFYDNNAISVFKEEINSFLENKTGKSENDIDWADLELGLGAYTEELSPEDYDSIHLDVMHCLMEYLLSVENSFSPNQALKEKIIGDFCRPDQNDYFNPAEKNQINDFKKELEFLNIINFNYTHTVETIFGYTGENISLGANSRNVEVQLNGIVHVHHSLSDNQILLGVNDESQVQSSEFRDNPDVLDLLLKPRTNNMMGLNIDGYCKRLISYSSFFVLFGVSLGDTDKLWWQTLGHRFVTADCRILYFVHAEDLDPDYELHQGKIKRYYKRKLFKAMNIENRYNNLSDRVFIGYGTNIFR